MLCRRIILFAVILLFLVIQVVPLAAKNRQSSTVFTVKPDVNMNDGGPGGGEEHPWQDNPDDDGPTPFYSKNGNAVITLFERLFRVIIPIYPQAKAEACPQGKNAGRIDLFKSR